MLFEIARADDIQMCQYDVPPSEPSFKIGLVDTVMRAERFNETVFKDVSFSKGILKAIYGKKMIVDPIRFAGAWGTRSRRYEATAFHAVCFQTPNDRILSAS